MAIRIIIADDHRVFIDGIKSLFKEISEFQVVGEAENGDQLIEQVALLKPDVVLTDVQMPFKDGIEATRQIHKSYPAIKVIALTMLNESLYIKKMLEAGASGYLLKTTGKDELIEVIKKVAAGEKHFNAEVTARLLNDFSGKSSSQNISALLTKREKEILIFISEGLTDKEIAEKVFLSLSTIITHRKNLLSKLNLKNKVELTRFALENNLLS